LPLVFIWTSAIDENPKIEFQPGASKHAGHPSGWGAMSEAGSKADFQGMSAFGPEPSEQRQRFIPARSSPANCASQKKSRLRDVKPGDLNLLRPIAEHGKSSKKEAAEAALFWFHWQGRH
jgi:hypothetical protein